MKTIELVRAAKRIVIDGGVSEDCGLGKFCLRCCLSHAKTDLDARDGTGVPLVLAVLDLLRGNITETEEDRPLIDAVDLISKRDNGIVHTRSSAIEILNWAEKELS